MKRLLMTPELLALKRAEMLTDIAPDGRWRTLKRIADSSAMTETSREWLLTLSAMGLLTDDPKYAARAEVLLASAVATGNVLIAADRGKPVGSEVFQLALCYDWIGDRLTPGMAERVRLTLSAWGHWIWSETNPARVGAWGIDAPWDNYHFEFIRGSWLAGLALGDDALIALSRQKWAKALAWLKEHQPAGTFAEGSNYGVGSLVSILEAISANFTVTGEEMPEWCHAALWGMLQMTSPGMGAKAPFGDQSSDYKAIQSDTDRLAALLMASFGGTPGPSRYWLDNIARNRSKRAQSLWQDFLLYPSSVPPLTYKIPEMATYHDPGTGYFSTRSGWEKDAVQAQGMCGPTFSSHQDAAGTFTLCRGNDWLIGHAKQWSASGLQHGAEFVNCITVDGRGQDNMLDKTAHVLKSEDNEHYTLWQCEAGQAYDFSVTSSNRIKPLKSWRRTLAFLKPGTLIVHDRVEKNNLASVAALHLNTLGPMSTDAAITGWSTGKVGASEMWMNSMISQVISTTHLPLGPNGSPSSWKTKLEAPAGRPVDEFLVAFQTGPAGFTPLPVTKTAGGVRVGDDEVIVHEDGAVEVVDHRVSQEDVALIALEQACTNWRLAFKDQMEPLVSAVVAAAKALIAVTG